VKGGFSNPVNGSVDVLPEYSCSNCLDKSRWEDYLMEASGFLSSFLG
jgi:hypothetical protein